MKTTNSAQKTENRSFGKSTIFISSLVLSLVLLGFTSSASIVGKHFPVEHSKLNKAFVVESRLAMGHIHLPAAYSAEIVRSAGAFFLETAAEKSLEIENWMTNEKYFTSLLSTFEAETEESLIVETWMLTGENFFESTITEERDETLNIENWMLDASIWVN